MNKTIDTKAGNGKRIYKEPTMEVCLIESNLTLLASSLDENELPVATEEWPEGVPLPW